MTDDELAAIRARVADASDGPWAPFGKQVIGPSQEIVAQCGAEWFADAGRYFADANFIAHARTDVPRLLDEILTLRAERDAVAAELAAAKTIERDRWESAGKAFGGIVGRVTGRDLP